MKYLSQCYWIFICFLLCGSPLQSVERMPWTQSEYILYPRFDVLYQHYSKIQSTKKSRHRVANDQFYTPGVSGTYENWTADAQITAANTHHQGFGFDNFRLTGSYQWMDDILDDPLSVTFGLSYVAASKTALHDISSFHHGQNEAEFYVSFGKEETCYDTWTHRWWGVGTFGIADHGSPWWRLMGAWEKQWSESLIFRIYAEGLLGMGGNALNLNHHFKGYGPIAHRSIDIGIRATKYTECSGNWIFEYTQRVYARNFPDYANLLRVSFIYPYPL